MVALTSWLTNALSTAPDPAAWQDMAVRDDTVTSGGVITPQTGRTVRLGVTKGWTGGFPWKNPSNLDSTSAANANGNPLIDRLVVRLNWNTGISLEIKRGTAAVSPVPPTLTQIPGGVWEMSLAFWTVDPGGANSISNLVIDAPKSGRILRSAASGALGTNNSTNGAAIIPPTPVYFSGKRLIEVVAYAALTANAPCGARAFVSNADAGEEFRLQAYIAGEGATYRQCVARSRFYELTGSAAFGMRLLREGGLVGNEVYILADLQIIDHGSVL